MQLNLVVFKCHWFDPKGGQRIDKTIGLVEVRPSTTYSGADVFIVAHQAKQVYYLPYPCKTKANLRGWEVVFQVSPHGNLPIPSEDDYNNIDPVTYEGIFYQEQEDFGDFELEPIDLEDVANDETRGETVVNPKDIDMLKKFHEENDNDDEPPPVDEAPAYYSKDSDSDSENENENENESDDEW